MITRAPTMRVALANVLRAVFVLLVTLYVLAPVHAQPRPVDTPTSPADPDVDAILAAYAEALGGTEPWRKRRGVRVQQRLSLSKLNVTGQVENIQWHTGEFLIAQNIPPIGRADRGFDGKRHWSKDPINGLRIVTGVEAAQARLETSWMADLRLTELYPHRKRAPTEDANEDCVELGAPGVPTHVRCFDRQTHLETRRMGTMTSPQGMTPYVTRFFDYSALTGVVLSRRQEVDLGPVTVEIVVTEVEWDPKVNRATFQMPRAGRNPALNPKRRAHP